MGNEDQRQVVALNTALVLWSAGRVSHWAEGVEAALMALASGEPWRRLQALKWASVNSDRGQNCCDGPS